MFEPGWGSAIAWLSVQDTLGIVSWQAVCERNTTDRCNTLSHSTVRSMLRHVTAFPKLDAASFRCALKRGNMLPLMAIFPLLAHRDTHDVVWD